MRLQLLCLLELGEIAYREIQAILERESIDEHGIMYFRPNGMNPYKTCFLVSYDVVGAYEEDDITVRNIVLIIPPVVSDTVLVFRRLLRTI